MRWRSTDQKDLHKYEAPKSLYERVLGDKPWPVRSAAGPRGSAGRKLANGRVRLQSRGRTVNTWAR